MRSSLQLKLRIQNGFDGSGRAAPVAGRRRLGKEQSADAVPRPARHGLEVHAGAEQFLAAGCHAGFRGGGIIPEWSDEGRILTL